MVFGIRLPRWPRGGRARLPFKQSSDSWYDAVACSARFDCMHCFFTLFIQVDAYRREHLAWASLQDLEVAPKAGSAAERGPLGWHTTGAATSWNATEIALIPQCIHTSTISVSLT